MTNYEGPASGEGTRLPRPCHVEGCGLDAMIIMYHRVGRAESESDGHVRLLLACAAHVTVVAAAYGIEPVDIQAYDDTVPF